MLLLKSVCFVCFAFFFFFFSFFLGFFFTLAVVLRQTTVTASLL